jgi:hypothetical protein
MKIEFSSPQPDPEKIDNLISWLIADMRLSRAYESIIERVKQDHIRVCRQDILLRQLKHRFKRVSPVSEAKINSLSSDKLDELLKAIFDFKSGRDLTAWLKVNGGDRV